MFGNHTIIFCIEFRDRRLGLCIDGSKFQLFEFNMDIIIRRFYDVSVVTVGISQTHLITVARLLFNPIENICY